jgi:hypothetical protein
VPNVLANPRAASAIIATALALTACHPRRPPPDLSRDPGPLLAQVRAAQARVQRVSGEARVKVEAKGMRTAVTVREFIAAEKPDRLHVEVLDFFGNVGAVLVASGGRFQLYDAKERVFYRGEATPENLARLVPLPLPAEDLVTILCGLGAAPRAPTGRRGAGWRARPVARGGRAHAGDPDRGTGHGGALRCRGTAVRRARLRARARRFRPLKIGRFRARSGSAPTNRASGSTCAGARWR